MVSPSKTNHLSKSTFVEPQVLPDDFTTENLNSDWDGQYAGGAVVMLIYFFAVIFIFFGFRKYSIGNCIMHSENGQL